MSIHDRLNKKQLNRINSWLGYNPCTIYVCATGGGVKPFICWALAEFEFSNFAILPNKSYFLFVVLNLFQHLTSLEDLFVINKILDSLKITDNSPNFMRFQNDTEIMFDFNSSPSGERICGRTTQLVANSDIPPQRGRL